MSLGFRQLVTAVLVLALANVAEGQRLVAAPIDSGTLIRIHLAKAESVRGRLLQTFTPHSSILTFCRYPGARCAGLGDARAQTVPAADVTRLEVSGGTHWFEGLFIGGAIGAVLGAAVASHWGMCESLDCHASTGHWALQGLVLGVALGLVVGSGSVAWRRAN